VAELAANQQIEKVIFACFDQAVYASYRRVFQQLSKAQEISR
jgi:hypothetical protein